MNLLRLLLRKRSEGPKPATVVPLGFQRSRWPALGLRAGGILTYRLGRRENAIRVSISWDALARVRTELSRHGKGYHEESIVPKLLVQWGCEKLAELLEASDEPLPSGLVFEAEDWPGGNEARQLLGRSGLI